MAFGCASDEQLLIELGKFSFIEKKLQELDDLAIDSKCAYCNCALRDCSLCGVSSFDNYDDDTPIC